MLATWLLRGTVSDVDNSFSLFLYLSVAPAYILAPLNI